MADSRTGVRSSLLQLQEFLSTADHYSAATASYQLIRGVGQECVLSTSPAVLALQTSLVFSRDFGLLVFIRKSLSIDEFRDCREEALKFLCVFLEKIGQKIMPYSVDVKTTCTSVYTKDRAAKCRIPALDLLIKLLQTLRSFRVMDEFKVGELFNKFYGELALKTKVPDTVLEKVYEFLGVLGEVHPSEMINYSENLFRAFLGELKTQMTSAVREPKLPVVAGCLKGLASLLCNFTKSMEEDPQTSREIFDFALKAICPQIDLKRYAVPLAGLRLFTLHASQLSTCLLDNYVSLFEVLSKWCSHTNIELKKAAYSALESFLKQVAYMVAKDAEAHKSKLQYFMEQFYGIIRNIDSNNKELSIAIRGYGLFAGPCKVINAKDVDVMYVELIQRCKQMFLTQTDAVDDHVYQMPSFLQSIASVLLYLDTVPEVYTPVLEHLMVVQIDSFPQYSPKMQLVCCKAIVKVFLALAEKGPVLWNCISTVVHQGLIRICSKPVILQKDAESESENQRASGEVRAGKWKVPTCRDYVDLFRQLLNCDQMTDFVLADETFLFVNSSLQSLNRLLYDEFIKSVLKIVEKLDLTLEKQTGEQEDGNEATRVWVIPTSDPAANLHPAKPKDFSAFINLVEFCREILPEKQVRFFEPWVYSFAYELILQSTRSPLISGFYTLLSIGVRNAKKMKYFDGVSPKSLKHSPKDPEKYSCFALFAKFGKEVSVKMKQYKDELLASCLTFVLSLPHDIIELDVKAYVPALQMAFKLGLSYTPLAEVGLNALKEWSFHIRKSIIQPYYKDILPCLDGYLKTSTLSDETKNIWEVSALSRAAQKGFGNVVLKHLKRIKNLPSNEAVSLEEIRIRVVQMLGSLGGQINKNLVTAASSDEMMKKCVAWDREKRLSFAVPFREMKPVIYLDVFLPRVTELALSTSDRQTKVAACELLHSMVMFMLGKATQIPEGGQGLPPLYQLYKHTFPVLLRLACDVDQVTRQLYEPLVMQLIHWFTNNKKFESQDTVALLETILDGIVDPVDSTLRDFCGQCIQEFLKWSIKQTTPQQQEKSPVNTKSLFKRLYSFALHPNAFKRLGASLAFNNIYREFREEEPLVEQFVFEALVIYMESLALAHADEKSLGTVQQCCDAIDHLRRIIEKKHASLNKAKKRRLPRGFPPSASLCLLDLVKWLLAHCGRPQTECRHKSIELFYKFVPLLPGNKSPSLWLKDVIKKEDISFLINTFEGGGSSSDRPSGILAQPTLFHLRGPFSLRAALQWLDLLLAALECYNTFIEEKTVDAQEVLGTKAHSSLWKSVAFFLESIAMNDITAAEKCFGTGAAGTQPSPHEEERYNYIKCTVVVRVMEFTTTLLNTSPEGWKLLEKDLCNTNLMKLLVKTVCEPVNIGFNISDVQVVDHLPSVCVNLMKALKKSPYRDILETHLREKVTAQSVEELCAIDLYGPDAHLERTKLASVVSACKQLHRAGFLHVISSSQSTALHHSIGMRLLCLVYEGIAPGEERRYQLSLDPSCKRLASQLLELAFAFGGLCEHLVSLLLNAALLSTPSLRSSQTSIINFPHGEYFYSLFSETINAELLKNLDLVVSELMKSSVDNPKMVSTILNGMLDQSFRDRTTQKHHGLELVTTILQNWRKCDSWWSKESTSESKMAVLALLAKILQIDSSVSFNTNHSSFPEVFATYASLLGDSKLGLHLKGQAVILLPFFTSLTGSYLDNLKGVLEKLIVSNFPMKSHEFPPGTLRYNNYVDCMKKFLDALELSQSPILLQLMAEILCREQQHVMEELFQTAFKRIVRRSSCVTQSSLLENVYRMFTRNDLLSNLTRQAFVDRCLLTLLWHCSLDALREFFSKITVNAIEMLKSRFTKLNESTFDTQITKKMGYYKMLEVMYSRLSKDDVHSKESKINQVFHGSCVTEGNELTKTLIKLCHDAFTENMAGETQLLERRRLYHCAAYNCAISVICCVFNELKFYQGFLFSEKPEKNLFIFENLIDLNRCYTFPIEVEVPMERRKRYIEIRREAREAANEDSDGPHYMSSLSYLADSSLSEEMSQFDFSTGVQSYSYKSQDPKSATSHFRRRERQDPNIQDDVLELEMDELNQHECMATMTALIKHMQRNLISPKGEESSVPKDLPPWMKFLHDKLGNPSVPLNIRLFLAKLIINTEEVFRSYAKHWLSPLLQLAVSENSGGEGIHYMVVEIVATVLSWTGLATPTGVPKDEVLANRLLHFLMKHVFHPKRAVFRHNLEIIKTLVECWKDCLSIPYRLIFEKFSSRDPNSKDNSVGIQLLGIVMANNLPPYDPKCGIESTKYFQALVNNMSFVKYKEVYAAAAEVLGLILQYITKEKNVLEELVCEQVVKQLRQHQNTMEDKFIVCLNKAVKGFPPLADRFLNAVFFLLPKFHGVMKTLCLEVILCRAEEISDLYLQLKSKDFVQVMRHRDDERQKVCLDIIYKMMAKLKPVELQELLNPVVEFISHPSPMCREQMYNILMWIYDNYRDPESQKDDVSQEIFKLAKDVLIQGLIDENLGLQLIIRNFWSHETRLPSNILDRLLALNSLYSPKIEGHFLSIATNFLLEMTSMSPDYSNAMFEHPLSECEFQEYTIDPDWRFRSTVLTPMFIETQASPSTLQTHTQEDSLPAQGPKAGQVRATQQQYDFTPTQTADGRSSFNWLTGSSIYPLADYTVSSSSSDSLSSSLLFAHKRSEKSQQVPWKSVGPDFGKKRLNLPGDEVDNTVKGTDNRAEILRLRRRFLKDQEKLSLIYAKKGIVEQKREKEIKSELKMKQDAQIVLYRSYRHGDLPDIQIKYSSLITPLQAVAQRDSLIAKQLFSSLFSGILKEMDRFKTVSEKNSITQKLLEDFNHFLNITFLFFPPFVSCIQEISCQHADLLSLHPAAVCTGSLASLQQPGGIRLLEEALLHLAPAEPPTKRVRGKTRLPPDILRWMELAKLYRSIGEYDVLRGIFSSEIGTKQVTQNALLAEARSDYSEAAKQYNEALNQEWVDGEPTEAEKDFWELASLDCYNLLSEWKSLEYCSTASVDSENPPDLSKMWSEPFYQETYLPYMIRSKLKLLLRGKGDQSLLTFMDEAMRRELQQALIELQYSQELSLLYVLQDDIDRAKYYVEQGIQIFMQNYSSIDVLLHRSRLTKLQSVQALTEIQEFISFISKQGNLSSQASLKRLLKTWTNRYPDAKMDPVNIWDDIITNRCFFLSKIEEKLAPLSDGSMSVDEDEDHNDGRGGDELEEGVTSLIQSCRFSMKMKMIDSARQQNNFSLAMKLLKELHMESKTRADWQVKWVQSYCQLSHCRSRAQSPPEQILTVLKTVSLLDENTTSGYLNKNILASCDQNILLGTTFRIMANALSSDPACLADMEGSKARLILELSGSSTESAERVTAGLYQRAFLHLSRAVQTAEDAQPSCQGPGPAAGVIDAYMMLVDFCDQQLRKAEENESVIDSVELQVYPALVVEKMLKALKLNSTDARLKFPRLLQIIEQYPEETLSLMTKEISSIPCWQFISWISHMVALLDKEEASAVQHTVEEIAENYPQAIVYPFIISSESYSFKDTSAGHKNKEFVARIKSKLDQGGVIQDFINALDQLSNPDLLFKDWVADVKEELGKNPVNKRNIEKLYGKMYAALGDPQAPGLGPFRRRFIQAFGKEFNEHFGNGGSELPKMKLGDFSAITDMLLVKMKKDSKPPGNLKECSPWMSEFKVEFLRNELEIPGQYHGRGKPLPEYHARISGFDERVKVMASIRRPKRIVIRGHDEREYPFLVKGGEDLRQDQRIEQLFEVMNIILSRDAACSQRNMQLRTYHVVPMTSSNDIKAPRIDYKEWLAKMSGKHDAGSYMLMYKRTNRTETVMAFRKRESKVPADLLKRAFVKMSTGPEAFLALRSHFSTSHALLCISHWLLGIGDRHLNNFMVTTETGGMIGIDFGHAFGSATQFLPVPELMPFRLTRQFINLMLPMKETGLVYSVMVHALRAFRTDADLLTNTMDVFVREPSFDWKNFEKTMLKKGGSWIQKVNVTEKNWYPRQKICYIKRKLAGANPAVITCDELFLGHEKSPAFGSYTAVTRGSRDHNVRAREPESGLSEETQVKCLLDQATDPNILGRAWEGWEPWM
ncbi:DNA-dependent protein kinase catalytic subunit isoform 3-T3 [Erethizon dorsatum]